MYYYALTLVKTRGERRLSDYRDYINSIPGTKQCTGYEDEKGLHVHLMLVNDAPIKLSDVAIHKHGWSIRFNKLNDPDDIGKWVIYCNKELHKYIYLDYLTDEMRNENVPPTTVLSSPDEKDTSEEELYSFERKYPRFDIRKVASSFVRDYLDESKRI